MFTSSRVVLPICLIALYYAQTVHTYNDVEDNKLKYENLIKDPATLKSYLDCFMSKGPCNEIAAHYKSHIIDSIQNGCKYCSKLHKHSAHLFLAGIMKLFPEEYKEYKRMYDKEGSHFQAMEAEVDKY